LIIDNTGLVATLMEAMLSPDSTSWITSLAVSALLELLTRTGIQQRFELWVAARLHEQFGLQWPMRLAQATSLKLVYLHSLRCTGYVTPTMALCIGCLRAIAFGDPGAILWLDISKKVWRVILAQLLSTVLVDVTVKAVKKAGLQRFELSARFAAGHPLRNEAFRDLDLKGYVYVFGIGGAFIYSVFLTFLGPAFVTGMCGFFAPNATQIWILRALECANATAASALTNETSPAVAHPRL
jgi:hypothetical protein